MKEDRQEREDNIKMIMRNIEYGVYLIG